MTDGAGRDFDGREFHLRTVDDTGGAILHAELRGEVDLANATRFEAAVTKLRSTGSLVLDLSPSAYFDSAGFAALDRLVGEGGLELVLAPTSLMRRAAALMGLPVHDDPGSARAALEAGPG